MGKEKLSKGDINDIESMTQEIAHLESQLDSKEEELIVIKKKLETFENNDQKEAAQKAKETLEIEFEEKLNQELANLEEKLKKTHKDELEVLKEKKNDEMLLRMEELRQKMVDSSQLSVDRLKVKLEKEQCQKLVQKEEEMKMKFERELL